MPIFSVQLVHRPVRSLLFPKLMCNDPFYQRNHADITCSRLVIVFSTIFGNLFGPGTLHFEKNNSKRDKREDSQSRVQLSQLKQFRNTFISLEGSITTVIKQLQFFLHQ